MHWSMHIMTQLIPHQSMTTLHTQAEAFSNDELRIMEQFRAFIRAKFGINLPEQKEGMIVARLRKLATSKESTTPR